jgi:hypothetical protein
MRLRYFPRKRRSRRGFFAADHKRAWTCGLYTADTSSSRALLKRDRAHGTEAVPRPNPLRGTGGGSHALTRRVTSWGSAGGSRKRAACPRGGGGSTSRSWFTAGKQVMQNRLQAVPSSLYLWLSFWSRRYGGHVWYL